MKWPILSCIGSLRSLSHYFSTPFHKYIPSIDHVPNKTRHNWNLGIACSTNTKHALQWLKAANAAFLENTDILKPSYLLPAYIYGVTTVQNWKHNLEDVLSKQIDWIATITTYTNSSSQLITVILLSRITILIMMSNLAVSVIASHLKKIAIIARIWW